MSGVRSRKPEQLLRYVGDQLADIHGKAGPLPEAFYERVERHAEALPAAIEAEPLEKRLALVEKFLRRYRATVQQFNATAPKGVPDLSSSGHDRPSDFWCWPDGD
jgi:hypothetical protein